MATGGYVSIRILPRGACESSGPSNPWLLQRPTEASTNSKTFCCEGTLAKLGPGKASVSLAGPSPSYPIADGMRWGQMVLAGLKKAQAMTQPAPWKSHIRLWASQLEAIQELNPSLLAHCHCVDPEHRLRSRETNRPRVGPDGSKCQTLWKTKHHTGQEIRSPGSQPCC